jgi:hypothetical protein
MATCAFLVSNHTHSHLKKGLGVQVLVVFHHSRFWQIPDFLDELSSTRCTPHGNGLIFNGSISVSNTADPSRLAADQLPKVPVN